MRAFIRKVFATALGMLVGSVLSFFIFLFLVAVIFKSMQFASNKPIEKKSILQLHLSGELVERHRPLDFDFLAPKTLFSDERTLGLFEINRAIDLAKADSRISGIYLEVSDIAGGWAAMTAMRRHLKAFAESGKFIYAFANVFDLKTYYLASVATKIYMQPSGGIEFNGLAVNEAFFKGLLNKLDVEPRVFRVGRFKAAVEPFILDGMSAENRKQNQELIDDIWAEVRRSVAERTKLTEARVDEIAGNLEAMSAADAKKVGLITDTIFQDELEGQMTEQTVGQDDDLRLVSPSQVLREKTFSLARHGHSGKKIAVIFAEGEINAGGGDRESIGAESLREDIEEAGKDEDTMAIVLRVNSPGGDALASDVLWRELRTQDDDLPVIVSMGDVAASGGYYISAAARYIFAEATTITGSIGVFGLEFGTGKFFQNKLGVKFDRVVTHPYADIGNSNRPMTAIEEKAMQREVERVYSRFLDVVQDGRGFEERSDLENIAEGRVWSGTKAKELGLVDEIGGLDQAIAKAAEYAKLGNDYEIDTYPKEGDPIMQLLERFSNDSVDDMMAHSSRLKVIANLLKAVPAMSQLGQLPLKPGIYARMLTDLEIK